MIPTNVVSRRLIAVVAFLAPAAIACDDAVNDRRDWPIPPTPQSANVDPARRQGEPRTVNEPRPGAVSTSVLPNTPGVIFGADEVGGPQACSALGFVSAKWISEDHFELARRDVGALVNTLREYSTAPKQRTLEEASSRTGAPGLKLMRVGPKAECGLHSDDILLTLNGVPVRDQGLLQSKREELVGAKQLVLKLERGGAERTLEYSIVD